MLLVQRTARDTTYLHQKSKWPPHPIIPQPPPRRNEDSDLVFRTLQYSLNHLVTHLNRRRKPLFEELLRNHEPLSPRIKVSQPNALSPSPGRKRKLKVVAPERIIFDRNPQRLIQTS